MTVTTTPDTTEAPAADDSAVDAVDTPSTPMVAADLLVEDVSIDGMCGVY